MAFNANQITVSNATPTALLVQGGTPQSPTAGSFYNITGSANDPLPVIIKNTDASITVFIGGNQQTLTTGNGYPLLAGASLPMTLLNSGDIPYALAASGSPKVAVLVGRQ